MTDLGGAVDIHVHAGPSLFDRKCDALELADHAAAAGMGGLVLKSHFGDTHKAAGLADRRTDGLEVYSSLTLNSFVGGLNPVAVEAAIATGARVVWMPTFSAANFTPATVGREFYFSNQSLRVLDGDGEVVDEVRGILERLASADRQVALGNGHLSREETFGLLREMEDTGLSVPYLITHADFEFMGLSTADQVDLAGRGALVEKCYLPVLHGDTTVEEVVESIRRIGPEQCLLSTDHGQADNALPPTAYAEFVEELREHGLTAEELATVSTEAPQRLLEGAV